MRVFRPNPALRILGLQSITGTEFAFGIITLALMPAALFARDHRVIAWWAVGIALLTGTNTTENHPVAATFFKEAARRGTKLIVVDPRRPAIAPRPSGWLSVTRYASAVVPYPANSA